MRNIIYFIIFSLIITCSHQVSYENIIRIKGSDTMLILNRRLATQFMFENEGLSVYVEGGGTETGITAMIKKKFDISAGSRPLEPNEIQQIASTFGTVGLSTIFARDALCIFSHPENSVKNISLEDLRKVYNCNIKNWNELGGENMRIIPLSRPNTSGTHLYFKNTVLLGEDFCDSALIINTTNDVIEFVKTNPEAIGYGGIGYGDSTVFISINNIYPNIENVVNNSYPITRYLRYYTPTYPKGNVKKFIDWVLSPDGQKVVSESGYVPLW
jgi:phosphate transport system substrate-binding protein